MEKPSPPPYTSIGHKQSSGTDVDEGNALIDHLIKRANDHLTLDADYPVGAQESLDRETKRIRNMLEFTLSVDYERNAGASISAADREHFVHLAEAFRFFRRDPRNDRKPRKAMPEDTEERRAMVAFFIKYLHEPCKALLLPLDSVYDCIIFLSRYTDRSGRYKGSLKGQLHDYGVEGLASKLYMDRTILIPRVFTDIAVRDGMIDRVKAIEEQFFDRVFGIESSTVVHPGFRGFQVIHSVKYEANEFTVEYTSRRKTMLARVCKNLSVQHWAKTMGGYIKGMMAKERAGKQTTDLPVASRGRRTSMPVRKRPEADIVPGGWEELM